MVGEDEDGSWSTHSHRQGSSGLPSPRDFSCPIFWGKNNHSPFLLFFYLQLQWREIKDQGGAELLLYLSNKCGARPTNTTPLEQFKPMVKITTFC